MRSSQDHNGKPIDQQITQESPTRHPKVVGCHKKQVIGLGQYS